MMGYKEVLNLGDPLQRVHKFQPIIPNPYISSPTYNHLHHRHNRDSSNNKGEGCKEVSVQQQVMVSSRWNPTPEQLTTLEELYQCGTRTPSSEQIQHITSQLRRYGKIEGKNVFYWFQNHKARERQKRRRLTTTHANYSRDVHQVIDTFGSKDSGFEDEEKRCKRGSFIRNKECEDPIEAIQIGPTKADMSTNSDQWFKFHLNSNNNINSTLCKKNATWTSISQQPSKRYCCSSGDGGDGDEATVAITLELFPIMKEDNYEDGKINNAEMVINKVTEEKVNDFVPYYQFL